MRAILPVLAAAILIAAGAGDRADAKQRGTGDGSLTDRSRIKIHERYPGDNEKRGPNHNHRYREKCYWYFKTTDGWWPTGATQRCVRVRVD